MLGVKDSNEAEVLSIFAAPQIFMSSSDGNPVESDYLNSIFWFTSLEVGHRNYNYILLKLIFGSASPSFF